MRYFVLLATMLLLHAGPSRAAAVYQSPEFNKVEPLMPLANPPTSEFELGQALLALNAGRNDEAMTRTRNAISKFGPSGPALELLGAALALQGDLTAAEGALQRAIALDPKRGGAFAKLADIALAKGDAAGARIQLERALALDPEDRRVHQRLGLLAKQRGDTGLAITHLERGIRAAPAGYVGVKLDLAALYNEEKRFAATIALLSGLTGAPTFDVAGWLILGAAYLGAGDAPHALDCAEQAMKRQPADQAVLQAYAIARRAAMGAAGAGLGFEDLVLPAGAATLATYEVIGTRLMTTGEAARAGAVFRRMVERFPAAAAAHYRLGTFLAAQQQYQPAMASLKQAAALDPREADIARAQAVIASRLGDPRAAVHHAERMVALLTDPAAEDLFLLASLRHEAGDLQGAERDYRAINRRSPFAPALNNLADLLAEKNDLEAARRLSEQAVALAPGAGWASSTLGWILLRGGDLAGAASALERAAQVAPNDPTTLYYLAELRHIQGREDEARGLLKQAFTQGSFTKQDRARALAARLG